MGVMVKNKVAPFLWPTVYLQYAHVASADRADDGCEVLLQRLTQWVVKLTSSRPTHYTAGTILKHCRPTG